MVKIASTFASVNNGLMLLVDATNGAPAAVLADEGMLTAWRTAAAGALITDAMTPAGVDEVAVLGTGEQALMQVIWLRQLRPLRRVQRLGPPARGCGEPLCGLRGGWIRCSARTAREVRPVSSRPRLVHVPLPSAPFLRSATHVTGIGTDMPGKGELPVEVFAGALVATDDHEQCLDHGDFGNAVRAGVVAPRRGPLDRRRTAGRDGDRDRRSVADLTGIGAADAAVAAAVQAQLSAQLSR